MIREKDLQIESFRNAKVGEPIFMRIIHVPSGIVVEGKGEEGVTLKGQLLERLDKEVFEKEKRDANR